MVFDVHSGFLQRFVGESREYERVNPDLMLPVSRHGLRIQKLLRQFSAGFFVCFPDQVPADSGDDLFSPCIEYSGIIDAAERHGSAAHAVFFDESGSGSCAGRLKSGAKPGGSGSDHCDIKHFHKSEFSCCYDMVL